MVHAAGGICAASIHIHSAANAIEPVGITALAGWSTISRTTLFLPVSQIATLAVVCPGGEQWISTTDLLFSPLIVHDHDAALD